MRKSSICFKRRFLKVGILPRENLEIAFILAFALIGIVADVVLNLGIGAGGYFAIGISSAVCGFGAANCFCIEESFWD